MRSIETTKESDRKKMLHKKRRKWQGWQQILLGIGLGVLVIVIAGFSAFFVVRSEGKKNLRPEEHYITFKGKEYKYREDIVNILCLGIDKEEPIAYMEENRGYLGMADAILLVSIDTRKHDMHVISIPRDTMADIQITTDDGRFEQKVEAQLCYQYAFGRSMEQSSELTVDTVSQLLYNIQIQRSCSINFEALPILNDAIGGVDVVVQEKDLVDSLHPDKFVYGETMHLDGELALRFVRVRNKEKVDGSVLRAERQKQYALAFAEKAKSVVLKDPLIPVKIFQELQKDKNMYTDMTIQDIVYLMSEVLQISFAEDLMQTIPGESIVGKNGYPEFYMDVDAVKELLINIFYEEV